MNQYQQEIHDAVMQWLDLWRIDDEKSWSSDSFRALQNEEDLLVIDDFGGHLYVFTGNEGYKNIWGPMVDENMAQWKISVDGEISIQATETLGVSSFVLIGGGTLKDGSPAKLRQYCTFVWEKTNGTWRMNIEHISTDPKYV